MSVNESHLCRQTPGKNSALARTTPREMRNDSPDRHSHRARILKKCFKTGDWKSEGLRDKKEELYKSGDGCGEPNGVPAGHLPKEIDSELIPVCRKFDKNSSCSRSHDLPLRN